MQGALVLSRSPSCYVILRCQKTASEYPCQVANFAECKIHIFEDGQRSRPSRTHPNSISRSFYSETKARAFCRGAGLPDHHGDCSRFGASGLLVRSCQSGRSKIVMV
eukprot:TRINITY_DN105363_c0_g1_i1.p1 TRINITY_DN105363_c0_g1~~TRINITY_DN105363_c0_g1_i1.p1  ORF type:complete len:107 (+),score=3.93 TRINITY_DN105363_c0_g1_i1:328-648(+)